MAGVADQNQSAPLLDIALALQMNLGDERTGRIEHRQTALGGILFDRARNAMGTENGHGTGRHLGQILDETRPLGLQRLDDAAVVNDLMADIDRRAIFGQGPLDDFDGPHHAGAKTPWLSQNDLHATSSPADGQRKDETLL